MSFSRLQKVDFSSFILTARRSACARRSAAPASASQTQVKSRCRRPIRGARQARPPLQPLIACRNGRRERYPSWLDRDAVQSHGEVAAGEAVAANVVRNHRLAAELLVDLLLVGILSIRGEQGREAECEKADDADQGQDGLLHGVTPHVQFRSLIWPLLSTTSFTGLPSFTACAVMPSAVDLTSCTCE